MIDGGMLPEFIDNMIEQINEDKLWQLYLATAFMEDKSFSDWKAAVLEDSTVRGNSAGQGSTAEEPTPEEAVAHAEGILAEFRPY